MSKTIFSYLRILIVKIYISSQILLLSFVQMRKAALALFLHQTKISVSNTKKKINSIDTCKEELIRACNKISEVIQAKLSSEIFKSSLTFHPNAMLWQLN